jgi:hypothetical protein
MDTRFDRIRGVPESGFATQNCLEVRFPILASVGETMKLGQEATTLAH